MTGDAAYDPWPLVDQIDIWAAKLDLLARTRFFADLLDLPAERILAWGVARSVESALWDVDRARSANGEAAMRSASTLARLF